MKRPLSSRFIAAAVLVAAALGAASAAQARPEVQVSIGLPGLPGLPRFVQPRPVYEQPPVVVGYERPWQPSYRPDVDRERASRPGEWERRESARREWERQAWERRAMERRAWERREWERRQQDRFPSHDRHWN